MMRHIVSAACGLWLGLGNFAFAQAEPGVVVELYTSQGCSSCPPADDILAKLSRQPGIIALALHVDYWDYIGWEDTFAKAKFTDRQKAYAHAAGSKMIYTPQMIIGGRDQVEGNQAIEVARAIDAQLGQVGQVTLQAERQGDLLIIRAVADPPLARPARVEVVRYTDRAEVAIQRGENAGMDMTYVNIVTDWTDVGGWPGVAPLTMTAKATGAGPLVVIIQSEGPGEILAAVRLPKP